MDNDFCVLTQSESTPDDDSVTLQALNTIKHNILLTPTLQSCMKDTGGPVLSLDQLFFFFFLYILLRTDSTPRQEGGIR